MIQPPGIDPIDFRRAASQYQTGVTIVTTVDAAGSPAGLTVNSFTSVSLHPPLVLVCIGRDSTCFEAFDDRRGFVVHVLAADQEDLAVRFAAKGVDRFAGVAWERGAHGLPVLAGCLARFECAPFSTFEGGDHLIFVGRVERLEVGPKDRAALGYHRGRYIRTG